MWDETRQRRFQDLREAEGQGALSEAERAELAALIQERCRNEEAAVMDAAQRAKEANALLEAQVQQVQAQNRELEALIREQEAYLSEVRGIITGMEERRRNWRERYQSLTGRPLHEPVPTSSGG